MALLGKFDVNCLPPGEKHPAVRPGRAVQFGRSLPKSGRDRPQGHFPDNATEKHACHVWCWPALPKKPGSAYATTFSTWTEKQKPQAPRPTRSLQKNAGSAPAVQCSRSLRKGLRDRLQGHDRGMAWKNKSRMPCFVQTGAPCKGQGAPRRRPFQPGWKNKSTLSH